MVMSHTRWSTTAICGPCVRRYRLVRLRSCSRRSGNASEATIYSQSPSDADDAYRDGENSLVLFVSLTIDHLLIRFSNNQFRCPSSTGKQTEDEIKLRT